MDCLEKDPEARPTASQMRERLLTSTPERWTNQEAIRWWEENRARMIEASTPSIAVNSETILVEDKPRYLT